MSGFFVQNLPHLFVPEMLLLKSLKTLISLWKEAYQVQQGQIRLPIANISHQGFGDGVFFQDSVLSYIKTAKFGPILAILLRIYA